MPLLSSVSQSALGNRRVQYGDEENDCGRGMDSEQFREAAKQLTDYIADYVEGLADRQVLPDVKPGFINAVVPEEAPVDGEAWEAIFNDIEDVVMKGVSLKKNTKIARGSLGLQRGLLFFNPPPPVALSVNSKIEVSKFP